MLNWTEFYARQECSNELRKGAEKEQLVKEALAARQKSTRSYGWALVGIGGKAVARQINGLVRQAGCFVRQPGRLVGRPGLERAC